MGISVKVSAILVLSIFLATIITPIPVEAKKWYEYITDPIKDFFDKLLGDDDDDSPPPPQPPSCEQTCPYGCLNGVCVVPEITKIADIPNQEMEEDTTHRVDLRQFFSVPEKVSLTFSSTPSTNIGFSIENGVITFIPKQDFSGEETVSIPVTPQIGSVSGKSIVNTFKLIVKPVNDPPKLVKKINDLTTNTSDLLVGKINFAEHFSDVDSKLIFSAISDKLKVENGQEILLYRPVNFYGQAKVTFTVFDGFFNVSDTITVTVLDQPKITPTPASVLVQTQSSNQTPPPTSVITSTPSPTISPTPITTPTLTPQLTQSQPTITSTPAPPPTTTSVTPQTSTTCSITDFDFTWSNCVNGWQTGIYTKKSGVSCTGGEPEQARQSCVYIGGGGSTGGVSGPAISGGPSGGPFTGGSTSTITTVAGGGTTLGDNGPATQAILSVPYHVKTDSFDNLYIADRGAGRIRKVDKATGIISTVSGYQHASDLALDNSGNIYFADDHTNSVKRIDKTTGAATLIAGTGSSDIYKGSGFEGDWGPAISAKLYTPRAIALDSADNIYVSDFGNGRIRKIDKSTRIITTVAGSSEFCMFLTSPCGDGSLATLAKLRAVNSIAFDSQDNMYFTDSNRVRRVDKFTDIITTVAGTGEAGSSGDGGQATSAKLNFTSGVDLDSAGNIYIAEGHGRKIRKVDVATGIITTIAGTGEEGYSGDGGQAINAKLQPFGLHISQSGKLYVADARYGVIRQIG